MILESFVIKHVKTIKDSGEVKLSLSDNINILAGQNEAGKSAVLEGLNFFRNGDSQRFKKSWQINGKQLPYVCCTFLLEDEDKSSEDELVKNILKSVERVSFFREGKGEIEIMSDIEVPVSAPTPVATTSQQPVSESEVPEASSETSNAAQENDLKATVGEYLLKSIPAFIFFDSFEDILPGEVNLSDISKYPAIKDFEKVFDIDFTALGSLSTQQRNATISQSITNSTVDLNKYWSQTHTTESDDRYNFEIEFNLDKAEVSASTITFMIHRNDHSPLFLEQKSKGFQWFSSFNLRLKAIDFDAQKGSKFILLIDEPGQGLHETAQKDVKKILEELASKGTNIIYSTHNPMLIGVDDTELVRIKLVYQGTRNQGTIIKNLAQFSTKEGSLDALSPIITAMGISHVGQLIDRKKVSVAVEGITDQYYFLAMKKLLAIEYEGQFIPACGADNLPSVVAVLIGWGSDYRAIMDDGTKGKSVYGKLKKNYFSLDSTELDSHIKKLDGFEGIEDLFSRQDFLKHILETDTDPDTSKTNSQIAKDQSKELLARKFLLKVNTDSSLSLGSETKNNFQTVFNWLLNNTPQSE